MDSRKYVEAILSLNLCNPYLKEQLHRQLMDNDYSGAFNMNVPKNMRLYSYKKTFDHIPDEQKYEVFTETYCLVESGFNYITGAIMDRLIQLRPLSLLEFLKSIADEKGNIVIYRGANSSSRDVKKALSWTLSRDKATWFAKRFNISDACIYIARANIKHVIAYINDRNEEEILIRYKHVKDIAKEIVSQE